MTSSFHACMIAGTHSGAGKTTVMLALEQLARQKGLTVQPFKGGPDYIDTGFHHKAAAPRRCRNLDLFLLSPETLKNLFIKNSQQADIAFVEGMMGLFDGKNADGEGSSAQIAKLLGIPVVLVVDGAGLAGSAAAIVLGFQKMDPELNLAGVIFNRVNSDNHFQYIKRAVEAKTGVPCLGFLPREKMIAVPERHLGLTTAVESEGLDEKIFQAAALLEKNFDWDRFLKISGHILEPGTQDLPPARFSRPFKIAVAKDEAFSFYYEDNFDLLREAGAQLTFFSPVKDTGLPEADLLLFGGGFPELYAAPLADNQAMIAAVRSFYHNGGWIYAECGGLMYLSEAFCDAEGREFLLAGLVPGKTKMTLRLQHFGYHEIEVAPNHFLFEAGRKVRSHEFHHSLWDGEGKCPPAYILGERREGFVGPRLVATYQHLHFASVPGLAALLIQTIEKERNFVC